MKRKEKNDMLTSECQRCKSWERAVEELLGKGSFQILQSYIDTETSTKSKDKSTTMNCEHTEETIRQVEKGK